MSRLLSLRARLVGGVMLVVLLLTAGAWLSLSDVARSARSEASAERLHELDMRVRKAVEAEQDALLGRLVSTVSDPQKFQQMLNEQASAVLLQLTMSQPLSAAWMSGLDGRMRIFSGSREDLARSRSSVDLARQVAVQGQVSGFIVGEESALMVSGMRMPAPFDDQAIFVARDVDEALAQALGVRSGLQVMLFKRRSEGTVHRLGSNASAIAIARMHDVLSPGMLAAASAGSMDLKPAGQQPGRMGTLSGSLLFAALPQGQSIVDQVDTASFSVLAYCIGALLILGAGTWMYSQRVSKGLGRLSHGAHQFANGKFETTVIVKGSDELVRAAETFNLLGQTLRQREAKIFQTANRDSVTGLPSRTQFETTLVDMVNSARANKKQVALITVVVDRLREANDSLGRKAGDKLLSEVGERLRRTLRRNKKRPGGRTFLARLATYEFGVIVEEASSSGAVSIARRLAEVLDNRIEYDGQSVSPGARIGVALYPDHGIDAGALLYSADIAATNARNEISHVAVFDQSFERDRERQLGMLNELRRALDNDELYIALLPKIGLRKDGELMAEALMRWEHPERGALNPGEFIPFAEKTGFITQLTNWMVSAALRMAAQWQSSGEPLNISVNVSPRDIGSPDFATHVVGQLRANNLRGNVLTLEVNESAVLDATPIVRQNLEVLSRLGVKIAIDDFGSGFASIDQLRALPLSYIMIDRQFVGRMVEDQASRIIIQAAIDLGHLLGLEVVGEGVESESQLEMLREMGCDQAQGFYVSKPLTDKQYRRWVSESVGAYAVSRVGAAAKGAGVGPIEPAGVLMAALGGDETLEGLTAGLGSDDSDTPVDADLLSFEPAAGLEADASGTETLTLEAVPEDETATSEDESGDSADPTTGGFSLVSHDEPDRA